MIPTGSQIRSGRELLGMSQDDLAIAANVGLALVIRAEMAAHLPQITRKDSTAIQGVLEAGGVEFVQRDGGVGVQMRKADQP
ncbi:transcriptional regulator [Lichenibacterium dinghuense]|uniref:transcriptional regulator n=1 Tax=Lichenibacterium dinghuense TaxID=2895977 RepID=UPI001F15939F|nr:transcriptional regulator [Lichenibacterium sp. 6Y81]